MDDLSYRLEATKLHVQKPITELLPPSLLLYLVPPLPSLRLVLTFIFIAFLFLLRLWAILPSRYTPSPTPRKEGEELTVAVFLGSGGHTTELLQLVSALPTTRYTQRIYLVSSGDRFSLNKAQKLERSLFPSSTAKVIEIPRARRVHQSFLSTPLTLARSVVFCIDHVALRPLTKGRIPADIVLMNGPGTCVPIVAAVYMLRMLGLRSPKLVYVESFARVKSLSLTAKLVRPLVDRFVLQWPKDPAKVKTGVKGKGNTVYSGWLV